MWLNHFNIMPIHIYVEIMSIRRSIRLNIFLERAPSSKNSFCNLSNKAHIEPYAMQGPINSKSMSHHIETLLKLQTV